MCFNVAKKSPKSMIFVIIVGLMIFGVYQYNQNQKRIYDSENRKSANNLAKRGLLLNDKREWIFEYGEQSISPLDLVEACSTTIDSAKVTVTCDIDYLDLSEVGRKQINYKLVSYDEYGSEVSKECRRLVLVKDTNKPIIKIKKKTMNIVEGDSLNIQNNIESVSDVIDGPLDLAKKTEIPDYRFDGAEQLDPGTDQFYEKGWYYIDSDVNTEKPGSYKVSVIACDKHGNEVSESFEVVVEPTVTLSASSNSGNNAIYSESNQGNNSYSGNNNSYQNGNASTNVYSGETSASSAPVITAPPEPVVDTSIPAGTFRSYAEASAWANAQLDVDMEAWYSGTLANPRTGFYADAYYTASGIEYWVVTFY